MSRKSWRLWFRWRRATAFRCIFTALFVPIVVLLWLVEGAGLYASGGLDYFLRWSNLTATIEATRRMRYEVSGEDV